MTSVNYLYVSRARYAVTGTAGNGTPDGRLYFRRRYTRRRVHIVGIRVARGIPKRTRAAWRTTAREIISSFSGENFRCMTPQLQLHPHESCREGNKNGPEFADALPPLVRD